MSSQVQIRRLADGDAVALTAFYNALGAPAKRTFHPLGETTSADACEEIIGDNAAKPDKKFDLIAVADETVVGWCFLWGLDKEEPTFGLGVADAFQGRGLGARLMDAVMDEARKRAMRRVVLTVVQDNERARRMYERRGFVTFDERTGQDGLPYFEMAARLGSPRGRAE